MSSQVLYRKWRPQRFADVVGQDHVTQTLLNALSSGRVAHAYLFCGPRGTGKTSMGRILAKAVNCTTNGSGEPCNQCGYCLSVNEGRAMDLIEVDAASNRGIDEMRGLREKVNFAPNEARSKVYIIDEVHMLTTEAFNALLKTLEEPPPRTVFVLATTEPHKLPATVISRCQRFDFKRISLAKTIERLAFICEHEGVSASSESLDAIARGAWGSLRDAENMLDQMVVGYGTDLGYEQIKDFLGLGGDEQALKLIAAVIKQDIPEGLAVLLEVANGGLDLAQFHRTLMQYLRGVLLAKSGIGPENIPAERDEELQHLSKEVRIETVIHALKQFGKVDLRAASYSALPFELALVELAAVPPITSSSSAGIPDHLGSHDEVAVVKDQRSISAETEATPVSSEPESTAVDFVQGQSTDGNSEAERDSREDVPSIGVELTQVSPTVSEIPTDSDAEVIAVVASDGEPPLAEVSSMEAGEPEPEKLDNLQKEWRTVIALLRGKGHKFKMDALLRSGEPLLVEEELVTLGFQYQIFVDRMNEEMDNPGTRRELEEAVGGAVGGRRRVCCVVDPKGKGSGGHLVRAAVEMGAKVVEEED